MIGYIKYKQPYVTWTPPVWPLSREISVGEEVARLGKGHLRRKFCEGRWLPKTDSYEAPPVDTVRSETSKGFTAHSTAWTYATAERPPAKKAAHSAVSTFLLYLLLIGGGGAILVFAWPVVLTATATGLLLCAIIYLWYLVTLGFAVFRFNWWLGKCHAKYKASTAKSGGSAHILACHHCKQRMRLPAQMGKLRITCPSCRNSFV